MIQLRHIFFCLLMLSVAGESLATKPGCKKVRGKKCVVCWVPCGSSGQVFAEVDMFKVFLADAESKPATDAFLIGPDGDTAEPDENGIVAVPADWDGKEVSIRSANDKRELASVTLKHSENKLLKVSTVPGAATTGGGGQGLQADRITKDHAATRSKMLNEARVLLKTRHERKRHTWPFPPEPSASGSSGTGTSGTGTTI